MVKGLFNSAKKELARDTENYLTLEIFDILDLKRIRKCEVISPYNPMVWCNGWITIFSGV